MRLEKLKYLSTILLDMQPGCVCKAANPGAKFFFLAYFTKKYTKQTHTNSLL